MRCPECNRFVSYEDPDPEVNSLYIDSGGEVQACLRVVRACAECGTELMEGSVDTWQDLSVEFEEHLEAEARAGLGNTATADEVAARVEELRGEHELSVWEGDAGRDEWPARRGGQGRRPHLLGVWLDYTVECSCGRWSADGRLEDVVTASDMDVLV